MKNDNSQNEFEGWAVFSCSCGDMHIQVVDDPSSLNLPFTEPKFRSDEDAVDFVKAQASEGSKRHKRALAEHQEPTKY